MKRLTKGQKVAIPFVFAVLICSVHAQTLAPDQYLVWGIAGNSVQIPVGSVITEAVLTISDVTPANPDFSVYLLDNPGPGAAVGTDTLQPDVFTGSGEELSGTFDGSDWICYLSQNNNTASEVWNFYTPPFVLSLSNGSSVQFSSALLQLLDYVGTGDTFGFGIDRKQTDLEFSRIQLDITVQSYQGTASLTTSSFSYGVAAENVFQQDTGADGLVVIEAEDFHSSIPRNGYEWIQTTTAGASGDAAMAVRPDLGNAFGSSLVSSSPCLDYRVNFVKTGIHYVWIRGYCIDSGSDSCHVGIDNQTTAACDGISNFTTANAWEWLNTDKYRAVAALNIQSPGEHTIHVWMREDGFEFDQIVLTTNAAYRLVRDPVSIIDPDPDPVAPVADAGADQTVIDSDENGWQSVTIDGTGSHDSDGSIVSYVWTEGTQTLASSAAAQVNLAVGSHTLTLTVTDNDGLTDSDTVVVTINDPPVVPDENVFQQDTGADGLVTIEAEAFHDNLPASGFAWTQVAALGSSGGAAMFAGPDIGTAFGSSLVSSSPRLDYRVNFVKTGTHYVWIRGYRTDGGDDSCHVGLDNQTVAACDGISNFTTDYAWEWLNTDKYRAVAVMNIQSLGEHTIHVWMREDGFRLDRIILTTDSNYRPAP